MPINFPFTSAYTNSFSKYSSGFFQPISFAAASLMMNARESSVKISFENFLPCEIADAISIKKFRVCDDRF